MAKRETGSGKTGAQKAARPSSRATAKATGRTPATRIGSRSKAKKAAVKTDGRRPSPGAKAKAGAKAKTGASPSPRPAPRRSSAAAPRPKPRTGRAPAGARPLRPGPPAAAAGLSDEEQILAAKYLPRDLPPRLFEEERFLFPESYHVNRVRLLVKDPDWIFAYWDVDPGALEAIGKSVGERSMALARLSLRVSDPQNGGSTDILLPAGARWWYVRTDSAARSYRAELGVILPSGEFRRLAESNRVTTPRVGPSAASARRRGTYRQGVVPGASEGTESALAEDAGDPTKAGGPKAIGPWTPRSVDAAAGPEPGAPEAPKPGGASDAFRPGGASDIYRR